MNKLKRQQKNHIIFDLLFIFLLNAFVVIFLERIPFFQEYTYLYENIQLEQFVPLIGMLFFSLFYFSIRRFFESRKSLKFAESLASIDPVTKLYHRHKLESKLTLEWFRFIRYHEPFSIVLLNIDDFKDINKAIGHREADRVILDIADTLLNNMRKTNFCARWSGDEFLILCPVCEIAQAITLAEKLRADMFCLLQDGVELSVSCGVSQADEKSSLEEMLNQAEQALTKAKKKGKNCVSD